MMNYEISKDMTITSVKTEAKNQFTNMLIEMLQEKFGEDNVKMVRTGATSKANEIGIRVGTVTEGGYEMPLVITMKPAVKEFKDRSTARKTYTAFDFDKAAQDYDDYLTEKATKKANSERAKTEKIARDTAQRAKEKAESIDF